MSKDTSYQKVLMKHPQWDQWKEPWQGGQGKGKMVKNGPQRTCDSHSQLTGQNLITPGAREVGNIALNSECIQPKFRGSTTEDKDRVRV